MAAATPNASSPDIVKNLNLEAYLDYLGVRLNHPKAAGKELSFNVVMPDIDQQFTLNVENGVLNYTMNKQMDHPQATIRLDRSTLDAINLQQTKVADAIDAGDVKILGDKNKVNQFISLLDVFPFWFNIVTP